MRSYFQWPIFLVSILWSPEIRAQDFRSIDFYVAENELHIEYYLVAKNLAQTNDFRYNIDVFIHVNGKRHKIQKGLSGDYFLQKPSNSRKKIIRYNVLSEWDKLEGEIFIELKIAKRYRTKKPIDKDYWTNTSNWQLTIGLPFPRNNIASIGTGFNFGYSRIKNLIGALSLESHFQYQFCGDFDEGAFHFQSIDFSLGPVISLPISRKSRLDFHYLIGPSWIYAYYYSDYVNFGWNIDISESKFALASIYGAKINFNHTSSTWIIGVDCYMANPEFPQSILRDLEVGSVLYFVGGSFPF